MHEGDMSSGFDETATAEKSMAFSVRGGRRMVGGRNVHAYER